MGPPRAAPRALAHLGVRGRAARLDVERGLARAAGGRGLAAACSGVALSAFRRRCQTGGTPGAASAYVRIIFKGYRSIRREPKRQPHAEPLRRLSNTGDGRSCPVQYPLLSSIGRCPTAQVVSVGARLERRRASRRTPGRAGRTARKYAGVPAPTVFGSARTIVAPRPEARGFPSPGPNAGAGARVSSKTMTERSPTIRAPDRGENVPPRAGRRRRRESEELRPAGWVRGRKGPRRAGKGPTVSRLRRNRARARPQTAAQGALFSPAPRAGPNARGNSPVAWHRRSRTSTPHRAPHREASASALLDEQTRSLPSAPIPKRPAERAAVLSTTEQSKPARLPDRTRSAGAGIQGSAPAPAGIKKAGDEQAQRQQPPRSARAELAACAKRIPG